MDGQWSNTEYILKTGSLSNLEVLDLLHALLPLALAQLNGPVPDIFPIHFLERPDKVRGLQKGHESVPFALSRPFIANHLRLCKAGVFAEGRGQHRVRYLVAQITAENTKVILWPIRHRLVDPLLIGRRPQLILMRRPQPLPLRRLPVLQVVVQVAPQRAVRDRRRRLSIFEPLIIRRAASSSTAAAPVIAQFIEFVVRRRRRFGVARPHREGVVEWLLRLRWPPGSGPVVRSRGCSRVCVVGIAGSGNGRCPRRLRLCCGRHQRPGSRRRNGRSLSAQTDRLDLCLRDG